MKDFLQVWHSYFIKNSKRRLQIDWNDAYRLSEPEKGVHFRLSSRIIFDEINVTVQ